jgi:hypothetical protein
MWKHFLLLAFSECLGELSEILLESVPPVIIVDSVPALEEEPLLLSRLRDG